MELPIAIRLSADIFVKSNCLNKEQTKNKNMTYNEWENKWQKKWHTWKAERQVGKFDDNLIATIKFPNRDNCATVYHKLHNDYKIFGKDNKPGGFCSIADYPGTYIKINRICTDLPLVLKVCEYYGGTISRWDTSLLEVPPVGGGIWTPEANTSKKGRGCYIATACYGNYDCAQVLTFRNFRDEYLNETLAGRFFIKTYYAFSPVIAQWLQGKHKINSFIRKNFLDRIYDCLKKKY